MTPIVMLDQLVERLKSIVSNFELPSNVEGVKKAPQVLAGYLPEKRQNQDQPDLPYVIARFLGDNETDEQATATVKIIVGTYSKDQKDGWRDTLNVLTRIKQELLARPVFGGSFLVARPIKTELPEEHPYPEWWGTITLDVIIPQMEEEGGF
ncbi:hypothetical protein QO009_002037 [Brevibacillus aydinogluensis]|jgi:hypothetical protein|uniref:hypothetical protein n=1 Tax=Brevibacillus aydinogluensis TaxID=927786 RepID=UPI0028934D8F|nr:hypothetical protein [Brevibacillus aydinogluensis]MDT3416169.1 hypothetical protein [Brevibacillus aydinogluensis]